MVCPRCCTPALTVLVQLFWGFLGVATPVLCARLQLPRLPFSGSCCACAACFWDFLHFMQLLAISLLSFYRPDRRYLLLDTHSYTTMLVFGYLHLYSCAGLEVSASHSPLGSCSYTPMLTFWYARLWILASICLLVPTPIYICSPIHTLTHLSGTCLVYALLVLLSKITWMHLKHACNPMWMYPSVHFLRPWMPPLLCMWLHIFYTVEASTLTPWSTWM
jgi:hypothetical protein